MPKVILVDHLFMQQAKGRQAFRVGARNGHQWCHMVSTEGADSDELHEAEERRELDDMYGDDDEDGE